MSDTNGATATGTTTETTAVEALQQAMVGQLMAVIGAPDDKDVARAGDDIVQQLDARLREAGSAAA
ncbi:hypothetical protein [Streptomyces genisteinicus]|uniref:Uncharacterized protein n=1 Tax=Streptomyces genisteinicus TaxID=2768068 RepID=A0A7H0I4N8_9ACTN|nr:hypothetical protein [Streptomyces genisteinicus]QNP67754.1 hypothetical protein IAG43_25600 [Streptomyces genisteinicus]